MKANILVMKTDPNRPMKESDDQTQWQWPMKYWTIEWQWLKANVLMTDIIDNGEENDQWIQY